MSQMESMKGDTHALALAKNCYTVKLELHKLR